MRRNAYLGLAICLLGLICAAAPAPQQPAGATITIQVTDKATGDPIEQADVSAGQARTKTDDYGQCSLTVPGGRANWFSINVTKPGYVSMGVQWRNLKAGQKLPEQLNFAMEPGTSVGGKVVDETGKPVSGATVHLESFSGQAEDGKVIAHLRADPKTDSQGMWSTNTAPSGDLKNVDYLINAPGYYDSNTYRNIENVSQLRDRSLVLTVKHAASIGGTVFDPTGKPVEGANVTGGREGWGGAVYRTRSRANGAFTLTNLEPGAMSFAVMSKDYAPQLVNTVAPTTQPVEVHLAAGKPMTIHVVDQSGKPIPNVNIAVDQWQNITFLDYTMHTNTNGDAVWPGAPSDEVQVNITKRGMGSVRDKPLTATTQPIVVTLGPRTQVSGTVTDAATGEPIKDFKTTIGIVWRNSQDVYWMTEQNGPEYGPKEGHDGQFNFDVGQQQVFQQYPGYAIRVEAPGYLPVDSRRFDGDEGDIKLEFKMTRGTSIAGTLYAPDHKPLAGADIYLVVGGKSLQVQDGGKIQPWALQQVEANQTDAQGRFSFSPQSDAFAMICINDAGYARIDAPAMNPVKNQNPENPFELTDSSEPTTRPSSYDMTLQPWATVEGKVMKGSKPAANLVVGLQNQQGPYHPGEPRVWFQYTATTGEEGKFKFDDVPPVGVMVGQMIRNENMTTYSHLIPVDAHAGQTVNIQMGGTGRPVVGKFAVPANFKPGQWMAWQADLSPVMQGPAGPKMPLSIRIGSAEAKRKWYADWAKTPEGKAFLSERRKRGGVMTSYALSVQPDGSFRVDDVPAGTYQLSAQFYPPGVMRSGMWGHPIGTASQKVTVPPMPGGRSDEVLDVGTVAVTQGQQTQ